VKNARTDKKVRNFAPMQIFLFIVAYMFLQVKDSLSGGSSWWPPSPVRIIEGIIAAIIAGVILAYLTLPTFRLSVNNLIKKSKRIYTRSLKYAWIIILGSYAPYDLKAALHIQREIYYRKDNPFRIKLEHCRKDDGTLDHECCSVSFYNEIQPPQTIEIERYSFQQGTNKVIGFNFDRNPPYLISPGEEKMDFKFAPVHGELRALFSLKDGSDISPVNSLFFP
jgi:hypothetical protein